MAANNYERRVENGRTEGNSRSQSPDREYLSLMVIHLMANSVFYDPHPIIFLSDLKTIIYYFLFLNSYSVLPF